MNRTIIVGVGIVASAAIIGCPHECPRDTAFPEGDYTVESVANRTADYLVGASVVVSGVDVFITYQRDGVTYVAHYVRP